MPYTMGLLHSVPRMDMAGRQGAVLEAIPGTVPDPAQLPEGCAFHPRCAYADPERCTAAVPDLEHASGDHLVRCIRWNAIREGAA
jgi:oligopeptide transport system ATP-binding protein